jgi:hypothetical protein
LTTTLTAPAARSLQPIVFHLPPACLSRALPVMAATYQQFLASPSSSLLADKASLHYVTTTTSVSGSTEIIKHLDLVRKQVKKKKEDTLNTVDAQTSAALEVDTCLEFLTSGGPYVPGLDDNFVADRVVDLPIVRSNQGPTCAHLLVVLSGPVAPNLS